MTTRLTFLGVAAFDIQGPEHRILIDPCLSAHGAAPYSPETIPAPDVILVTHAAFDHLGDTIAIARRTGAPVVCGADVQALLHEAGIPVDQVRSTVWGIVVKVGGVVIRPVECHHWSLVTLAGGQSVAGVPMGFIIETEPGVRIYHYGDTAIFEGLRLIGRLYQPTIGLLGCTQPQMLLRQVPGAGEVLTGELSPREAALAAEMLQVKLAVACHYLDVDREPVEARDVADFLAAVEELGTGDGREGLALAVGESLVVDGASHHRERS